MITVLGEGFTIVLPTRLRLYRFHVIAYPLGAILGLAVVKLMGLSSSIDWWVNDATVYLELLFSISGTALCIVLVPVVWWLERRPDLMTLGRIGRVTVNVFILVPYFLIVGMMLFYRE